MYIIKYMYSSFHCSWFS